MAGLLVVAAMLAAAAGFVAGLAMVRRRWAPTTLCPGTASVVNVVSLAGKGICPVCTRWVPCDPTETGRWWIGAHAPRLNPGGKPGVHSPDCVHLAARDECLCSGGAS